MTISKNIKIGVIIGLSALVGVIMLRKFVFKSNKAKVKDMVSDSGDLDVDSVVVSNVSDFPLKYGSTGNKVKDIQKFLNYALSQKGKPTLLIDGVWGSATDKAFKDLKKKNEVKESEYKVMKAYLIKRGALAGAVQGGATG